MLSSAPSLPTLWLVNAHGRQRIEGTADERVIDVLARVGVPWSALSIYAVPADGGAPVLRPCLDERLGQLTNVSELLLYFNRNVNPFLFSLTTLQTVASADPAHQATEYVYQHLDNARSGTEALLKKLSPDECRAIIAARVADTIGAHVPAGSHLVVGVSGGGDSNALLHGLSRLGEAGVTVHPVIIKGIPDWDSGVIRAQALCDSYGLALTIVEESGVKALLGIAPESESLIDRFQREFPGDDFEFLGTLLIRLALSRHARELGTPYICTGLNLEDVLCEAMFRISNGLGPATFPVREIGDIKLVLPLWLCPKRIIDGCFPRMSLENYDGRYPCFSLGRNLYYSVVYSMQSQYPGFVEQLAQGLSQLATRAPSIYTFDDQLGFHVERMVPLGLRQKFQRLVGRGAAPA